MFNNTIFLDIGTHDGQTLEEVVKPLYEFKVIYSFEPMPKQYQHAFGIYSQYKYVKLFNYGLSDKTATMNLYGSNNNMGASIYATKRDVEPEIVTPCIFVEASKFFRDNLSVDDSVIMKLNCEGSEIPILNNLIDSGEIWKIANVMIDFDIRKVEGMGHEELLLMERFNTIGFDRYVLCDTVMVGSTHQARINNWLTSIV